MKISYYELLELVKNGAEPKRIKVKVCDYPREYVAEYDGDDFCHYEIEDKRLQDDNYKLFLGECFLESTMFDKCIEIIEEDEDEDEFENIEELKIGFPEDNPSNKYIINEYGTKLYLTKHSRIMAEKINELIKNQKKIIEQLKNK